MKPLRLALLLVVVVAIAGGVYVWQTRPPGPTVWQGYAEGDDVFVGPTLAGQLVHVDVARGQLVKKGDPLFEQDATGDEAAVREAQANLDTARATLANLVQPGGRPEQIAQAEADLADKTAVRKRIEVDLARDVRLLPSSAVSQQQVDTERQALASAVAQEAGSAANLALLRAPSGRADQILAQRATEVAAQAALAQAQWQLSQRRVTAPASGIVVDVVSHPGEALTAGATVVDLLPAGNLRVRFFVPEADLATLRYGQHVAIGCHACGGGFTASISYISPQPEYTPPVIYSETSRGNLVYRIEATPPPDDLLRLHPGQPLDVRAMPAAR